MYRRGYVEQAQPVVYEQRSLADLWQRRMPIIAEDAGYDPNRDRARISSESNIKDGVNPLAFLVGPVVVKYGGEPAKCRVAEFAAYIPEDQRTVLSATGQLSWNYGQGLCTVNAPKAQGATGFLSKAGMVKLADVEIRSGNDYATVLAVAMDDKPLRESRQILVQVGTTERPMGWKTKPATLQGQPAEEVLSFGHAPWMIVDANLTVTLHNSKITSCQTLDANGQPVREIRLSGEAGSKSFQFPTGALYVILRD
ncbi:conserved hypothetical protein [Verrucomicrobia bacterium]|nr:conserved hypothetical protein [Verrucomicrobiota bacterium]